MGRNFSLAGIAIITALLMLGQGCGGGGTTSPNPDGNQQQITAPESAVYIPSESLVRNIQTETGSSIATADGKVSLAVDFVSLESPPGSLPVGTEVSVTC